MKVLHVTHVHPERGSGGVEHYLRELFAEQPRHGVEPELLAGAHEIRERVTVEEGSFAGRRAAVLYRDEWFHHHHVKAWHPHAQAAFRAFLRRERPALLHVHQWLGLSQDLVQVATQEGVPAVVTLHDLYASCPRVFRVRRDEQACFRPLSVESCLRCVPILGHEPDAEVAEGIRLFQANARAELSRARAVLAATDVTADLVAQALPFPRDRITVLPLGYARRFGTAPPRPAALPGPGQPLRFGYWGNLTQRKGAQVLVGAFRRLCAEGLPRPAELHLYGRIDTPLLEAELRNAAAGLPVRFHGRYEYPQLAAAGLHVAIFPFLCFETFAFVLDEAFELRLPVVVTDLGALSARSGGAAVRVPPRDEAALASALRELLHDPARLETLRAAIPPLAPTVQEHARALAALYERAARSPAPEPLQHVEDTQRLAFLLLQRESALRRLAPDGGPK
ncbi:MAG: glycosyltransferase [Planctomycetes bacterium]|nr:glycosyltransferase [Planctomycetota bacterium]